MLFPVLVLSAGFLIASVPRHCILVTAHFSENIAEIAFFMKLCNYRVASETRVINVGALRNTKQFKLSSGY